MLKGQEEAIQEKEQKTTEMMKLAVIVNALKKVETAVAGLNITSIEVNNLEEVKAHLRNELHAVVVAVKGLKFPDTVKVSNFPKQEKVDIKIPDTVKISNLSDLTAFFKDLKAAIEAIQVNPQVSVNVPDVIVPEIKLPTVNVPTPQVTVEPQVIVDINALLKALKPLNYLSLNPARPLAVRLSDGQNFLKAMKEVVDATQKTMYAFSSSAGMSMSEYKKAVTDLNTGTSANNTYATVGVVSGVIVAANANRVSVDIVNDSDTVIYLAKGATAVVGSGIRLNANGGSVSISDWKEVINGISSGANKNATVCETSL